MEGQAEAASEGDPDTRRGTPAVATAPAPPRTAAAPVDVLPLDDGPEEDFLDQLIASERVAVWLSTIRAEAGKAQTSARLKISVSELAAACQAEAYAEEARLAGAVQLLTTLLKRSEDEELLGSISDALSACSGIMAASRTASTFTYGSTPVMIREGSLGDGVGARMWTVAHAFCRELASKPGVLVGKTVLEIGSGCGACGILAAKLGAQVTLTDYVDSVLHNLRYCMHLNSTSSSGSSSAEPKAPATAWDAPPSMCARFYDWNDSMGCLSEAERAALAAIPGLAKGLAAAGAPGGIIDTGSNHNDVPALDDAARFEVVLGTDVLYEWPMVMMLPAVLKHRLKAPGGKAMLCCAVREQAMFEAFILALNTVGMNVDTAVIEPLKVDSDLLKVRQSYEGGFKVVIVSLPQVVD